MARRLHYVGMNENLKEIAHFSSDSYESLLDIVEQYGYAYCAENKLSIDSIGVLIEQYDNLFQATVYEEVDEK